MKVFFSTFPRPRRHQYSMGRDLVVRWAKRGRTEGLVRRTGADTGGQGQLVWESEHNGIPRTHEGTWLPLFLASLIYSTRLAL